MVFILTMQLHHVMPPAKALTGMYTSSRMSLSCLTCTCGMQAGHSVLIFCCSKVQCEVTAKYIAKILTIPERHNTKAAPQQDPDTPGGISSSARASIVAELSRYKGSDSGGALRDVVARGAAWHHSGLNGDQRELVEKAFSSGRLVH